MDAPSPALPASTAMAEVIDRFLSKLTGYSAGGGTGTRPRGQPRPSGTPAPRGVRGAGSRPPPARRWVSRGGRVPGTPPRSPPLAEDSRPAPPNLRAGACMAMAWLISEE